MIILTLLCLTEVDPKTAIFSWRYIDGPNSVVNPITLSVPSFKEWTLSNSKITINEESNSITLNKDENATIEYTFEIKSNQIYNYFYFKCCNDQSQTSKTAICKISTPSETIDVDLGDFYNYSTSNNINQMSMNITLENNDNSPVTFSLPTIIAYRSPYYSDITLTQQYPVEGQTKAVFCELFLNESIGKIELHTIHVNSPHKIPDIFLPHNQEFAQDESTSIEFTTLPIISSETRIVGMNIYDSTLKLWRIFEVDDKSEIGYCIDIEPVPPFRVSYIIIETSTSNFADAIEIWHNQFNESFTLPKPVENFGSIATPPSRGSYCITSFNQKFQWGSDTISGFPEMKKFLPIQKFTITIPISPGSIENCSIEEEGDFYDDCKLVKKFAIVNKNHEYTFRKEDDENYAYDVIWSSSIKSEHERLNKELNGYSGFAIDFSVSQAMNYNEMLENPQYFLINKDGARFKPVLSSMYQLLYEYYTNGKLKEGNIFISDFCHPQFINVILNQGILVNLIDPATGNLKYDLATHGKLWKLRAQMASCPFTVMVNFDARYLLDISEDLFSICLTLGGFPSFYFPEWGNCMYLDYVETLNSIYKSWFSRFRRVHFNTTYYANGLGLIEFNVNPAHQIPPFETDEPPAEDEGNSSDKSEFQKLKRDAWNILNENDRTKLKKYPKNERSSIYIKDDEDEDESHSDFFFGSIGEKNGFYEATMHCNNVDTEEDGVIDCFAVIMLGINATFEDGETKPIRYERFVTVTFSSEKDIDCEYVSNPLTCHARGLEVDLNLTETMTPDRPQIYRAALITFKYRIGPSFEDWFRENLGAILGSLLGILVLFIAMGFGFWFMYCRKKKGKNILDRIVNKERKVRKEKRKRLIKLNEKLNATKSAKENDFQEIIESSDLNK